MTSKTERAGQSLPKSPMKPGVKRKDRPRQRSQGETSSSGSENDPDGVKRQKVNSEKEWMTEGDGSE